MAVDLFATAARLSDCICAALKAPREGCDSWEGECCVQAGEVSFDGCCEGGGQAWVSIQSGLPTSSFPSTGIDRPVACDSHMMAVTFEVGVLRCICTDDCGCDQKEADAQAVISDLQALLAGVTCCLGEDPDWRLLSWEIIGPEGGCAGSRATIAVEQPFPCC